MSASAALAQLTAGRTPQQLAQLKDQNHDAEVYTCAAVFSALAIIAVILRVTSRHMKKVAFGVDDALITAALIISLAQTVFICIGVQRFGLGRHLWTLTPDQFVNFNKLWFTIGSTDCTGLFLTKISLLMLYHRIFITPSFRLAVKVVGGIMALWWIGTILADNLLCIPIDKNWYPDMDGHCGNKQLVAKIPPIPWIVTDLAVLLMPIAMVWKLHLPSLQRVGLAGLFLLGGFSTIASCVRYSLLFYQPEDVTFNLIPATIWTIIELDVTIISVCLIVSKPWFARIYPSKLISLVHQKLSTARKSSSPSSNNSKGRHLFSTFRKADDKPPMVTKGSMGGPFKFDFDSDRSSDLEMGSRAYTST